MIQSHRIVRAAGQSLTAVLPNLRWCDLTDVQKVFCYHFISTFFSIFVRLLSVNNFIVFMNFFLKLPRFLNFFIVLSYFIFLSLIINFWWISYENSIASPTLRWTRHNLRYLLFTACCSIYTYSHFIVPAG